MPFSFECGGPMTSKSFEALAPSREGAGGCCCMGSEPSGGGNWRRGGGSGPPFSRSMWPMVSSLVSPPFSNEFGSRDM